MNTISIPTNNISEFCVGIKTYIDKIKTIVFTKKKTKSVEPPHSNSFEVSIKLVSHINMYSTYL